MARIVTLSLVEEGCVSAEIYNSAALQITAHAAEEIHTFTLQEWELSCNAKNIQ